MEMRVLTTETSSLSPGPGAFPGGANGKESACQCRRPGFDPLSPREANGNPLQYSCLRNPMDKGAWWATVPGAAESRIWLNKDEQMAGALRSLSVKFPFREEPMGRCFTLDILHLFSFLRRVSAFLGLAHANTGEEGQKKTAGSENYLL